MIFMWVSFSLQGEAAYKLPEIITSDVEEEQQVIYVHRHMGESFKDFEAAESQPSKC